MRLDHLLSKENAEFLYYVFYIFTQDFFCQARKDERGARRIPEYVTSDEGSPDTAWREKDK